MTTPLNNLECGTTGHVAGYGRGDAAYRAKLLALGLTRGARVRLVNQAPFGGPLELEVRGFHLSLRRSEASVVEVDVEEASQDVRI